MARVYDSPPPADDYGGNRQTAEFVKLADIARKRKRLFRRADSLQVALCEAEREAAETAASLTAEQNAADIATIGKLAGDLKRRHNAAAAATVVAASAALQSAGGAGDDYTAAGILAELRGIL